jgi:hypothetical protein
MFQKGNSIIALGVGDGANDVSMIQEARMRPINSTSKKKKAANTKNANCA